MAQMIDDLYDQHEIDKLEAEAREREEFDRRVREEVVRITSGAAEEDLKADAERREATEQEQEEEKERQRKRKKNPIRQIVTGTILTSDGVKAGYNYLLIIILTFFFNIIVLFGSLQLDVWCSSLSSDVQKLREKALRIQTERFARTSHSAIIEQLRVRGIELYDPVEPKIIIED